MKKRQFSFALLLIIGLAGMLLFSSPALAKKKPRHKTPAPKLFVIDASLGITYDDNIIRYSDADLDLFSLDSLPSKFAIESKNDWIVNPQIRPRLQGKLIGNQLTSITLGYDYFGYVRNDVRRYSRFSIEVRQNFKSNWYGQLSYGYIPKYYYRNLFIGIDTTHLDQYLPARFSKHAVTAEVGYNITKSVKAAVDYQYQHKSFNQRFNYRDLSLNGFSANASWRIMKPLRIWTVFNYEIAGAKGANMPDTILDFSYNAWDITVGAWHYSTLLPKYKPEIYASFQFRRIDYQSNRLPDVLGRHVFQFGRSDNNYLLHLGAACQIPYQMRLEADYFLLVKRASLPNLYPDLRLNIPQTTAQLEQKLNYSANTISLRVLRQF